MGARASKGADGGVDGLIHFLDEHKRTQQVVVQVKSGKVSRPDIGDLRGRLQGGVNPASGLSPERRSGGGAASGAAIGVFITLEPPTGPMQQEAFGAGYYESEIWGRFPRIQILTIEQLLDGATVEMPTQHGTFRQAPAPPKSAMSRSVAVIPRESKVCISYAMLTCAHLSPRFFSC